MYFVIIPSRSNCTMWMKYPTTGLVWTIFKKRYIVKNERFTAVCSCCLQNLKFGQLFCRVWQINVLNGSHMCSTIVFFFVINPIVLCRCHCRSHGRCLNSLLFKVLMYFASNPLVYIRYSQGIMHGNFNHFSEPSGSSCIKTTPSEADTLIFDPERCPSVYLIKSVA